ncbi:MAG: flagellar biosynthesis anti-sigma factor FlgM [Phycisphaerales bacterium]|nr:MAG: flagellar biosynthesis anti-sigma factor FlgM [Phycisphaerales bacterium]
MADISSIGHGTVGPVSRAALNGTSIANGAIADRTDVSESRRDRVELSDHARFMERLRESPGVRTDLVQKIRAAIADGSYETDEKIQAAAARLMQDLF